MFGIQLPTAAGVLLRRACSYGFKGLRSIDRRQLLCPSSPSRKKGENVVKHSPPVYTVTMILYVKTKRFSATAMVFRAFAYYYYYIIIYRGILHNIIMCRTLVNAMHIDIIIVHFSSAVESQLYRFCTYDVRYTYYLVSYYLQRGRARYRLFYPFGIIIISFAKTRVTGRRPLHVLCDV